MRRKRREKINHKQSESSSTSISSLLESSSKNVLKANKFPMLLPQSSVTLELGVINTEPMASSEQSKCDQEQDAHQLIGMCRRWRELSRKSRENHNIDSNSYEDQYEKN